MYRPELSVVVCAMFWKLERPASFAHSTTWAPDTALPTKAPEITTLRPAVEGFGAEAMVRLPAVHAVGQQPPGGQHVVDGQQVGWAPTLRVRVAGCTG